ncbi:MAG TPA: hypothetical protein VMU59_14465 [Caulobacteraceae bacterium]|nr:hypothetical protein [Caulobacteraceae bacterium]
MANGWANRLAGLAGAVALEALAPHAGAQTASTTPAPSSAPKPGGAEHVLCDDYREVEQAALQDFTPIAGKFSRFGPLIRMAPRFLAPRLAPAKLVLPDADGCDVRSSSLNPGKNAYSCLWKSQQPDYAAADQAKRIAFCLDADVTKSDFSTDLTVVTQSKVRFRLTSEHHYDTPDGYAVRLMVDGPQF